MTKQSKAIKSNTSPLAALQEIRSSKVAGMEEETKQKTVNSPLTSLKPYAVNPVGETCEGKSANSLYMLLDRKKYPK